MASGSRMVCKRIYGMCGHDCGAILIPNTFHICPRECQHLCVNERLDPQHPHQLHFTINRCCEMTGSEGYSPFWPNFQPMLVPMMDDNIWEEFDELALMMGMMASIQPTDSADSMEPWMTVMDIPFLNSPPDPTPGTSQPTLHLQSPGRSVPTNLKEYKRMALDPSRKPTPANGQQSSADTKTKASTDVFILDEETAWEIGFLRCSRGHFYACDEDKCDICQEPNPFLNV